MNRCVHGLPTILRRLIKANNHIDFFNDELMLFYWGGRKHEIIDYREPKTSPKYEQTGATYFFIITKRKEPCIKEH